MIYLEYALRKLSEFPNAPTYFIMKTIHLHLHSQIKHQTQTSDEVPFLVKLYHYAFNHIKVDNNSKKRLDQKLLTYFITLVFTYLDHVQKSRCFWYQKWKVVIDYRRLKKKTSDDNIQFVTPGKRISSYRDEWSWYVKNSIYYRLWTSFSHLIWFEQWFSNISESFE